MHNNIILLSDSYKVSHWKQYPPKTETVYSYFESRGGQFDSTLFFGLQYIIKRYLTKRVTRYEIDKAEEFYTAHFGTDKLFNRKGWEYIADQLDGYLPVRIRAVPEGTWVPTHNVLMTVENTDPNCAWLTNFLETLLSQVWYPSTVATISGATRARILKSLNKTGDPAGVEFKLHDFGFRGVSSVESAGIGGAAHLVNFMGTDTLASIELLREYYGADMPGFSVPASEHSTITSWGRENEVEAFRNMIEQYGDQPFYSVVSDSYDIYKAAGDLWGGALKGEVLAAEGTLVVRPDSGYPPMVVSRLLEILGEKFGYGRNDKGFKVLNPKVRIIQGDGLDYNMIDQILNTMEQAGWSADNIVFGMGGGLLQKCNRDTQKFAFKCSSVTVDGEERDVFKDPATDNGKVSKKGRLALIPASRGYATVAEGHEEDVLRTVWENGRFVIWEDLAEIKARATGLVTA